MLEENENVVKRVIYFLLTILLIAAYVADGFVNSLNAFFQIQVAPARIMSDFVEVANIGGALLNASLVGFVGLYFILKLEVKVSGPTFAAVLTMVGFGLFGKTIFNIFPIIYGVRLSAKFIGKEFKQYIIIALFGTALGPLVSCISFELFDSNLSLIIGPLLGIVVGFILPPVAVAMLHLHQGYNLYNMGLTCGFIGLFASGILKLSGHSLDLQKYWSSNTTNFFFVLILVINISLILISFLFGIKNAFRNFWKLQFKAGRLPSDFMDMSSIGGGLLNSGILGLVALLYVCLVGGELNGPVCGAIFTVMGFAAFGSTLRNAWPVALGVIIAACCFSHNLSAPVVLLATIFVTTLGPLAGEFGNITGIIAGFLHLSLALSASLWHSGLNLYNNGFAGGLTATLIVAIIQWYRSNKTLPKSKFGGL